jgi:hypothetical protein
MCFEFIPFGLVITEPGIGTAREDDIAGANAFGVRSEALDFLFQKGLLSDCGVAK